MEIRPLPFCRSTTMMLRLWLSCCCCRFRLSADCCCRLMLWHNLCWPKNVGALFPYLFIFLCFVVCLLLLLFLFGGIKSCRENVLFTEKCISMSARDIYIIAEQTRAYIHTCVCIGLCLCTFGIKPNWRIPKNVDKTLFYMDAPGLN